MPKGYITPGVTVTEIDKTVIKPFVRVEMDDLDFEEIVDYIEYAKENQWVLSGTNQIGMRDDLIKDIAYDYFEKHDINIHPGQITEIYDILVGLGINTDDVMYVKKDIRINKTLTESVRLQ